MQETGSVNQFIKPEGSLCPEASGNAETGAQAGALSTSACSGMQNKAAQETEEEATGRVASHRHQICRTRNTELPEKELEPPSLQTLEP